MPDFASYCMWTTLLRGREEDSDSVRLAILEDDEDDAKLSRLD